MALIIQLKVMPNASKHRWVVDKSGQLKGYLKSPAQQGLANKELIKTLAQALNIPQKNITILTGLTSQNKRIKIEGSFTYDQILQALGIEKQLSAF